MQKIVANATKFWFIFSKNFEKTYVFVFTHNSCFKDFLKLGNLMKNQKTFDILRRTQ